MDATLTRDLLMTAAIFGFFASVWFGWAQENPPPTARVPLGVGTGLGILLAIVFGILSALQVLKMMREKNSTIAQLAAAMSEYPSQLANIPVKEKPPLESLTKLKKLMTQATKTFGNEGRHLIRYSGTENKIRVLVEHRQIEEARIWLSKFAAAIRDEIG